MPCKLLLQGRMLGGLQAVQNSEHLQKDATKWRWRQKAQDSKIALSA